MFSFRRVIAGGLGAAAVAASAKNYSEAEGLRMGIFAPPGGGKGTVCANLTRDFGLVQISTGDLLRAAKKEGTPLGLKAKSYMEAGELVPADLIHEIVAEALMDPEVIEKGFILDGVCRSKANSEFIVERGLTPDLCLILDVSEECVVDRLGGRIIDPVTKESYSTKHEHLKPPTPEIAARCIVRKDDQPEAIKKRFDLFQKGLKPVLSAFPPGIIKKIDGEGHPTEVYSRVVGKVNETIAHKKMEALFQKGADPKSMIQALEGLEQVMSK
mmetsp:Transcript_6514/g.11987  ORF Transcript_6514/g.11987 Transcript_6514/m.11987 type:complete len:271 (+) Transcript_6514:31-843(+)|eukprot:CAMPEP_0197515264 /NCGR_PEP_ID=MMETSP1318-20131121/442_1 /TAXON_ID=552666 /ORGANISM="Partenskyella glossopodia, Strain RCC365" /LENGTH=270 /DNA_ID=CAMNT_0043063581 /DNA_START=20 /DNA_END=832 /DNA_ORIENTATION=+